MQQAKAVYEISSTKGEYKSIDKLEIVFVEQEQKLVLPQGIWGEICQKLVTEYGKDTYRNWFSKLTATIETDTKTIELKATTLFYRNEIIKRYGDAIKTVVAKLGME